MVASDAVRSNAVVLLMLINCLLLLPLFICLFVFGTYCVMQYSVSF